MSETNPHLKAIVREVSRRFADCELTYIDRESIDIGRAREQHAAYVETLSRLGVEVVVLPEEAELPDSTFVEDTAVVLDEIAVMCPVGAASRKPESKSVAIELCKYRPVKGLNGNSSMDGGDVLQIGQTVYVGGSARTNKFAEDELKKLVYPYGYSLKAVRTTGCLHLKTGCTYVGRGIVLINREWIDAWELDSVRLLDVPVDEPFGANVLKIEETLVVPASSPKTADLLRRQNFDVRTVDISEFQKAEAGVTCLSLVFST
jgi:dimethylargininase